MIENVGYLGKFHIYQVVPVFWHSTSKTGAYLDRTTAGDMEVYLDDSLVPMKPLVIYDHIKYDDNVGLNVCEIVLGLNDDYINHRYNLLLRNSVIDSETVSSNIAFFDIAPLEAPERYYPAMRKLITPRILIDE